MRYSELFTKESTTIRTLGKNPGKVLVKAVPVGDGSFCNPAGTGYWFVDVGYGPRFREGYAEKAVEEMGSGVYRTKLHLDRDGDSMIEITFELVA